MPADAPLAALLPLPGAPPLDDAQVLDRFVSWVASSGLTLYPAQEEAILELLAGQHVVLTTPTGSGKSLVATFLHFKAMAEGKRSFYTCPIKALVNEKFFALCDAFGAGERRHDDRRRGDQPRRARSSAAPPRSSPTWRCARRRPRADAVVMDEFHYYGDRERGVAWQVPLLPARQARFLLMSATLGDVDGHRRGAHRAHRPRGRRGAQRRAPGAARVRVRARRPLHETIEDLVSAGRAPIYLVNFTQRAAAEQAQNLMSVELLLEGGEGAAQGGPDRLPLRHALRQGAAALPAPRHRPAPRRAPAQVPAARRAAGAAGAAQGHQRHRHAGRGRQHPHPHRALHPALQVRRREDGHPDACATSSRSPGAPGARASTTAAAWWRRRPSTSSRTSASPRSRRPGKKVVKKKPPQKGYVHWDRSDLRAPRRSRRPSRSSRASTSPTGCCSTCCRRDLASAAAATRRLRRAHRALARERPRPRRGTAGTAAELLPRRSARAGLVELARRGGRPRARTSGRRRDLQRDFSLNHTLSLYLVDTPAPLDPERPRPTPSTCSSLVESILENPDVVLWAQLDQAQGRDGRRAQGARAWSTTSAWRSSRSSSTPSPTPTSSTTPSTRSRPSTRGWAQENIRPKSVAREMFERCQSFNDYVREYGLQRSEGVLLRYLSEAYKTLVQTRARDLPRRGARGRDRLPSAPWCAGSTRACSTSGSGCATRGGARRPAAAGEAQRRPPRSTPPPIRAPSPPACAPSCTGCSGPWRAGLRGGRRRSVSRPASGRRSGRGGAGAVLGRAHRHRRHPRRAAARTTPSPAEPRRWTAASASSTRRAKSTGCSSAPSTSPNRGRWTAAHRARVAWPPSRASLTAGRRRRAPRPGTRPRGFGRAGVTSLHEVLLAEGDEHAGHLAEVGVGGDELETADASGIRPTARRIRPLPGRSRR